MAHDVQSSGRLVIALATDRDHHTIYRLRHEIYARELGQHEENPDGVLSDPLDAFSTYIVASRDGEVVGFISVTPPGERKQRYSIEDHLSLTDLPFPADDGLYEFRLLTVVEPYRGRGIASLLMYAALRWVEGRGGRRVVAVGRPEVEGIYLKAGLQPLVRRVRAGVVTFELLTATVEALHLRADSQVRLLARLARSAEWRLDVPNPAAFNAATSAAAMAG
ncbi:MAG: GNAT family N-acetyltransferase [bacterium]|nr:GNAT family N-acetyltransferase [bacterium]